MNAVNSLSCDLAEAKLTDAIERANGWLDAARPIILATFALEDAEYEACRSGDDRPEYHDRTAREVRNIFAQPQRELAKLIEGIRDDFRCDECVPHLNGMTEAEDEAALAFNDALEEGILSVPAAIKIVIDEFNARGA